MTRLLFLCSLFAATVLSADPRTVVFFGDSLTAGYGIDPDDAYPALIQKKIAANGLAWRVVNAGLSGETSAGGLRRIDWILRQPVDCFVLELGGNDGMRGIAPVETQANLQAIIDRVRATYPQAKIIIAGMQMPPNYGEKRMRDFAALFPALATKNQVDLIPFLLEGVGGVPELNLPDGIHPTAEGHALVAQHVWKFVAPLLQP